MADCRFGKTAIHYAVNDCETGSLAELIEASANVNAQDFTGMAPVWLAAESDGREEYMRMLINANCDVNVKDKREKRTPLQVRTGGGILLRFLLVVHLPLVALISLSFVIRSPS